MKLILNALIIIIFITSSIFFVDFIARPDGYLNGRGYYLKNICIKSHIEINYRTQHVGKTWKTIQQSDEVCDDYKLDTIWENN